MFSTRWHMPLKVGLALSLAIVIALWLGWEKPYWAGYSVVVMAVTESTGHSLKKGRQRIWGTFCGVLVAFLLTGLFAQQPVELLVCFSLFVAICIYNQTNQRNGYAWAICMMIATLILVMGGLSSTLTFNVAVLRIQETLLGVFCFSLVCSFLWPTSSRIILLQTLQGYFDRQATLLEKIIADLAETGHLQRDYSLGNSIRMLSRLEDLIYASMEDSYELSSTEKSWQQLLKQQTQWTLLCGHLYEAIRLIEAPFNKAQQDDIKRILHHLLIRAKRSHSIISIRLNQQDWAEEQLLTEELQNPTPMNLCFEIKGNYSGHSHGALKALEKILNQMDKHHYIMYTTLLEALGFTERTLVLEEDAFQPSQPSLVKRPWVNLDPERAISALKVAIMFWISIALWLYVPMDGGPMIILFGGVFGAVVLSIPFFSTRSLLFYMLGWAAIILLQYIFILPYLNEIWQLGAFYFINAFAIWFIFNKPQQILHRLLGTQSLVMVTNTAMQLTPHYDILGTLLVLLLFTIGMLIIFFVNHGVFSANPERVFLRQLSHFRHSLQSHLKNMLVSKKRELVGFISPLLLKEIAAAESAINLINWKMFPELKKIQAEQLISRVYSLCLHYRAFSDSGNDSNPLIT